MRLNFILSAQRAQPRISSSVRTPWASIHAAISSAMVSIARGLAKFAAPTCTAAAPAMMNSSASRPVAMPPRPTTGMFTAPTACHAIADEMAAWMDKNGVKTLDEIRGCARHAE